MKTNHNIIFNFEEYVETSSIEGHIKHCQELNHIQQVSYSTFHQCLTQICFTCKIVRSNIALGDK